MESIAARYLCPQYIMAGTIEELAGEWTKWQAANPDTGVFSISAVAEVTYLADNGLRLQTYVQSILTQVDPE